MLLRRLLPRHLPLAARAFAADAAAAADAPAVAEFREMVRDFAAKEIAPHAAAVDESNSFPKGVNLWQKMGSFGLLGKEWIAW